MKFVTREFELKTHGVVLVTCRFELVIRGIKVITRGFELVTCEFELVTRESERFDLNSCFWISTRDFEIFNSQLVTLVWPYHDIVNPFIVSNFTAQNGSAGTHKKKCSVK